MIKETTYIALDGTRFTDEEECCIYENKYVEGLFSNGFRAFDEIGNEIPRELFESNFRGAFDRSYFLDIPCEKVVSILDTIRESYGISAFGRPGKFRWACEREWVELKEELADLNSGWSALGVHFSID